MLHPVLYYIRIYCHIRLISVYLHYEYKVLYVHVVTKHTSLYTQYVSFSILIFPFKYSKHVYTSVSINNNINTELKSKLN